MLPEVDSFFLQRLRELEQASFSLLLDANPSAVVCEKILRLVPGKRLVAQAHYAGTTVIAKLFFDKWQAKRHYQTECRGYRLLEEAGFLVPLQQCATACQQTVYVCLYEKLTAEIEGSRLLSPSGADIDLLCRYHQAGFIQTDVHPYNFLKTASGIYSLDFSSVKPVTSSWWRRWILLNNAALFFAQYLPAERNLFEEKIKRYLACQQYNFFQRSIFYWLIHRKFKNRTQKFLAKIFRSASRISLQKNWRKRVLCQKKYLTPAMKVFLDSPEDYLKQSTVQYLKKGNKTTVFLTQIGKEYCVVKRYNVISGWHRIRKMFSKTRAAWCWQQAHFLKFVHLQTPDPIAIVENRWGPLSGVSYFVTAYVPGERLCDVLQKGTMPQQRIQIKKQLFDMTKKLHSFFRKHGDLKTTNFIFFENEFYFTDLDSMKNYCCARRYQLKKEWAHLVHRLKKIDVSA